MNLVRPGYSTSSVGRRVNALMLSIRPKYAGRIFDGTKSVELRRLRPRVSMGDIVVIYVSAPIGAVLGSAKVGCVLEDRPTRLWKSVGAQCGLTRAEFASYFSGVTMGFGIVLHDPFRREKPVTLQQLQRDMPKFRPPQGYKYLREDLPHDRLILAAAQPRRQRP